MKTLQRVKAPFSETGAVEQPPEERYTIDELRRRLDQYSGTHSESEDIARWADSGYLWFMEEAVYEDRESEFLCDILGDIEAQWEMLMANAFDHGGRAAVERVCFPEAYISEWISQIDSVCPVRSSAFRRCDTA